MSDQGDIKDGAIHILKGKIKNVSSYSDLKQKLPDLEIVGDGTGIVIPGLINGGKRKELLEKAGNLLSLLNVGSRAEHKPSEMSGGEQQRVAVARALINDPAIILADEPSGNLDSENANELHQLFIKLKKELNQTFVIVTHNRALAKLSDRTIEIKDGKIVVNE